MYIAPVENENERVKILLNLFTMYAQIFEALGIAKNEGKIYETLLAEGELSVGKIATRSKIHRRNVYDSLNRLIEKGLVFEIILKKESQYKAVDPNKLMEMIQEKKTILKKAMPGLESLYRSSPRKEEVYIYRGPEGWKNYMRDMLRIADEAHFIGAKGAWLDHRVKHFFPQFIKEAKKKKIKFYHLFDHEVQTQVKEILPHVGKNYRFLPPGYSAPAAIDLFGDHVNIISGIKFGGMEEEFSITVIVNQRVADAFRLWFKLIWDLSEQVERGEIIMN